MKLILVLISALFLTSSVSASSLFGDTPGWVLLLFFIGTPLLFLGFLAAFIYVVVKGWRKLSFSKTILLLTVFLALTFYFIPFWLEYSNIVHIDDNPLFAALFKILNLPVFLARQGAEFVVFGGAYSSGIQKKLLIIQGLIAIFYWFIVSNVILHLRKSRIKKLFNKSTILLGVILYLCIIHIPFKILEIEDSSSPILEVITPILIYVNAPFFMVVYVLDYLILDGASSSPESRAQLDVIAIIVAVIYYIILSNIILLLYHKFVKKNKKES